MDNNRSITSITSQPCVDTIRLRSNNGQDFVIPHNKTQYMKTIDNLIKDISLSINDSIPLPNIDGNTLAIIIQTMGISAIDELNEQQIDDQLKTLTLPILTNVLLAANYLDFEMLLKTCIQSIIHHLKGYDDMSLLKFKAKNNHQTDNPNELFQLKLKSDLPNVDVPKDLGDLIKKSMRCIYISDNVYWGQPYRMINNLQDITKKERYGDNNDLPIMAKIQNIHNVTQVSCGPEHIAIIADGLLYTYGYGNYGQLGHGNFKSLKTPTRIQNLQNVTQVSCGSYHTAIIINKQAYTFGCCSDGQLGQKRVRDLNIPTLVTNLQNVTKVSCGGFHTAIIAEGLLYTFGRGLHGQLGHMKCRDSNIPVKVSTLQNVTQVSCGENHTVVVAWGDLYTFGHGRYGELGHGNYNCLNIPTKLPHIKNVSHISCGSRHTSIVADGLPYTFGNCSLDGTQPIRHDNINTPTLIPNVQNVSHISCYRWQTAIVADGLLYMCYKSQTKLLDFQNVNYVSCSKQYIAVIASHNE